LKSGFGLIALAAANVVFTAG